MLQGSAVSAGVPSFVAQEEFDRYVGYWWQPVSSPFPSHLSSSAPGNAGDSGSGENSYVDENGAHCGVYRIMYEEVSRRKKTNHCLFNIVTSTLINDIK